MKEKTNDIDILEEELRKDILYQIDMQLYDEFNDKFCEIEENLGTVYSYKDLEDLKKAESDTERRLLRQAISNLIAENKELKEENKWKPIKEYNRKKYDWVLVKYFDGDYECVPEVAEQRIDGKWYTSEKQIPFEVKYFFDKQSLLRKE